MVDDKEDSEMDLMPAEMGFIKSVEDGEEGICHGGGGVVLFLRSDVAAEGAEVFYILGVRDFFSFCF